MCETLQTIYWSRQTNRLSSQQEQCDVVLAGDRSVDGSVRFINNERGFLKLNRLDAAPSVGSKLRYDPRQITLDVETHCLLP
jgi:hypothetical protein